MVISELEKYKVAKTGRYSVTKICKEHSTRVERVKNRGVFTDDEVVTIVGAGGGTEATKEVAIKVYQYVVGLKRKRSVKASNYTSQYVYLLEAQDYVKVGMSSRPRERVEYLMAGLPFKKYRYGIFATEDMRICEKELHNLAHEYRTNGEWFNIEALEMLQKHLCREDITMVGIMDVYR